LEGALQRESTASEEKHARVEERFAQQLQELTRQVSLLYSSPAHHSGNSHQQFYALTSTGALSAKIVRQGQDEKWYNFVNATEILPHQPSKFRVKINKAKDNRLMVGFSTSAGLGV
jgi:hypothetical protein